MIDSTRSLHGELVCNMFSQISRRYDLMNRIMSAGQDLNWRMLAVKATGLQPGNKMLDVAAGTGDMVYIAKSMVPNLHVVAVDFNLEMMEVGRRRNDSRVRQSNNNGDGSSLAWAGADTYTLPFPDDTFDAVTSAFLLRNLADPLAGLKEQTRVLKPGGRLVMLDATPPPDNWLRPLIQFHLEHIIPWLGKTITGSSEAYVYFPRSVANFIRPQAIIQLFDRAGLEKMTCRTFMFGTSAMVAGTKQKKRIRDERGGNEQ
ncbi:MAG: ubiquinone/menaquinone biosynthesis methyltransferase [Anaerolineales bacterium]|nr:ubiquinone/menaquinone biosynthesis methyltransferase [Anaerolineales bacterium]